MEKVTIESFTVNGISVRTDNASEMNPGTAQIENLWQRFYAELAVKGITPSTSFGVYSNYESDQYGQYDIAAAQTDALGLADEKEFTIPSGTYLKFSKSGTFPEVCIELWQEIWRYFETSDAPKRNFNCDYEAYVSPTECEVYIGIEE